MKWHTATAAVSPLAGILVLSGALLQLGHRQASLPLSPQECQQRVGVLEAKCCQPGRRWGCDPENFGQSGCTPIDAPLTNCYVRGWLTMACRSAACRASQPEHLCSVDFRRVGRNVCHPTGERTTLGCPADQWQCKIEMIDYTHKDAPMVDVLVCRYNISTICDHDYSDCD